MGEKAKFTIPSDLALRPSGYERIRARFPKFWPDSGIRVTTCHLALDCATSLSSSFASLLTFARPWAQSGHTLRTIVRDDSDAHRIELLRKTITLNDVHPAAARSRCDRDEPPGRAITPTTLARLPILATAM